ncbi:hypothetical protein C0Q70_10469 [Pomacea canaliculata]|uniref:Uncharacterized protein n=1 Tax=Pomacea canaliculata TaxID=400727 RepID=A0A2T7P394_POMCA|nr:hypothetical protein C0Q70_10469 [Pomacea canaliculata]
MFFSLPATECETQALVEMAAGRVGSQEVLGLLMSRGTRELLSAQLDMSLTVLIQIVRQIQESSLSNVTSAAASHLGSVPVRIRRQTSVLTAVSQEVEKPGD